MRLRSLRAIVAVERHVGLIAAAWALVLGVVVIRRLEVLAVAPSWSSLAAHLALIVSPALGLVLAARFFPRHALVALPEIVLARIGRWRRVDPLTAQSHPSFGASGLMAGLAIGLLINVAMRTGEFMIGVPAIASVGPGWARMLFFSLAADCVLFNLLYAAAFVLAVRHVPWFPRVLLLIWTMDVASQLVIAQLLGDQALPAPVARGLVLVLTGNIQKTMLSMALWLPYLLLSERVNVTYRRRVRR
ncbi:DUF2569 domain-containing protein [Sphingobium nicotianae]|nr:DUF2569 domain-containing protein [Sphingobium nicotianae]